MKAPNLDVSVQPRAGADILRVSGEVDLATRDEFTAHLRDAQRPDRALIIDLRELSYIDVRGAKALDDAGVRANTAGQRCIVVSSNSLLLKVFSILQFDGRVAVVGTLDDALGLLDGRTAR